jgi:ABC-type Fe3+/spermidine/putrescine transport system ATPase subunit
MTSVLELRNISKRFPGHTAVDSISLELAKGEFFALLGPSGCGKTTTLRLIAGFEQPSAGEIRLNGSAIQHLKPSDCGGDPRTELTNAYVMCSF